MKPLFRNASFVALGMALVLGIILSLRAADQGPKQPSGCPKYTVVTTDGSHLIVVNNSNNKLHFYAVAPEGKIGDDLTLRGTVDLHDVGKEKLTPVTTKHFKKK
jgi:hypothetical protein